MAITVSRTDAEIICALALEDLRGYSKKFPDAHAAYLSAKRAQEQTTTPIKERQTRKSA